MFARVKLFFAIFMFLLSLPSYSWNALAHQIVANIAYERLTPEVRKKVDMMVSDLSQEYPEISQFNQIAPWPDSLRGQKIELYTHWHYTNLAFSDDGSPLKNMVDTDNAVWAINQLLPILENAKANRYERARSLAFLVHIVGDLHQPLHSITRISAEHPDGDLGGNLYFIKYPPAKPQKMTMHKLWDQGIDFFTLPLSEENVILLSKVIIHDFPPDYFNDEINNLSADHWADEGLAVSSSFIYKTPEDVVPDQEYLLSGKQIAEKRVALAGYRLANLLNQIVG